MVNKISDRIKRDLNITMADFCQKHLKTDYRTFQYRMRKARYYPSEVIYICWLLDDSCENIFGRSFMGLVVINDGPEDAIKYVRERIADADAKQRGHLLSLIGMSVSDYKVEGVVVPVEKPKGKHIEKLKVVEKT